MMTKTLAILLLLAATALLGGCSSVKLSGIGEDDSRTGAMTAYITIVNKTNKTIPVPDGCLLYREAFGAPDFGTKGYTARLVEQNVQSIPPGREQSLTYRWTPPYASTFCGNLDYADIYIDTGDSSSKRHKVSLHR